MRFLPKFNRDTVYALTAGAGNLLTAYYCLKSGDSGGSKPSSGVVYYPVSQQLSEQEAKALTTGESTSTKMRL